jgi:hypothetical protein
MGKGQNEADESGKARSSEGSDNVDLHRLDVHAYRLFDTHTTLWVDRFVSEV